MRILGIVLVAIVAACGPTALTPSADPLAELTAACTELPENGTLRSVHVQQQSMEPLLAPGDVLLVATAPTAAYRRADVVAFVPPSDWVAAGGEPFLKRIVGLGGDRIAIRDGRLVVNDIALAEPYLAPGTMTHAMEVESWHVPAGAAFVLGDARASSADSRAFGPVPLDNVIGRIVFRCAPAERRGPLG